MEELRVSNVVLVNTISSSMFCGCQLGNISGNTNQAMYLVRVLSYRSLDVSKIENKIDY